MAGLTAEFLAARPGGRKAGLHPFAEQVPFELRDSGQHRCHHPPVRRVELERHAAHRDHGDLPASELVERIEKVLRRPSPRGQLGDQYGVDPASLREFEDAISRELIIPGSGGGFLEDAAHLEATTFGEGSGLVDLALTGLIGVGARDCRMMVTLGHAVAQRQNDGLSVLQELLAHILPFEWRKFCSRAIIDS